MIFWSVVTRPANDPTRWRTNSTFCLLVIEFYEVSAADPMDITSIAPAILCGGMKDDNQGRGMTFGPIGSATRVKFARRIGYIE